MWENDYKHILYFSSKEEQTAYFNSKAGLTETGLTFQRKDGIIRYPHHIDDIYTYNYVVYRNPSYTDKYYYAFITDMQYINDGMTEIHIETDVMQTFMLNDEYFLQPCFVEREHCIDDTRGNNLVDEGLGTGEYICNLQTSLGYADPLVIVVGVTEDKDGNTLNGQVYNGIYSGIKYNCFNNDSGGMTDLGTFISEYGEGKADAIICMFLAPQKLVDSYVSNREILSSSLPYREYIQTDNTGLNDKFTPNFEAISGHTVRNNKLNTYPYRYLYVSNNNGGDVVYHYENWIAPHNSKPAFEIQGCLTPGCSIRLVPWFYKNTDRLDTEGLNLGKFPTLNWTSDYYTNWLTQNAVNIGVSSVSSLATIGAGIGLSMTGAGALAGGSMIAGGVTSLANTLGDMYKADIIPNQAKGNLNAGDVITASKHNDFIMYDMCIKPEMAEIIDSYFDMYGYKTMKYKLPYIAHRKKYWYTKTINCDVTGTIPNDELQKIKNCFDFGVTFWRRETDMGNYYGDNGIVSG